MPKFACRCGYVINLTSPSMDEDLILVPDVLVDRLAHSLDEGKLTSEDLYSLVDQHGVTARRCSSCGRIHVQRGHTNFFDSFVRETE